MGLDDALRKARAQAAEVNARKTSDEELAARAIPVARESIRRTLRETLSHLPAEHPEQILRLEPSRRRFNKGRYDIADRMWPLMWGLALGSDLSLYPMHSGNLKSVPTIGVRLGSGIVVADPHRTHVLSLDAKPLDLDRGKEISVLRGNATPVGAGPDHSFFTAGHAYRTTGGYFTSAADGTIFVLDKSGWDADTQLKLDDVCAQLIVKMTS
jgi:hypothetical protein